ncbi:proteinrelated to glucan 1, 4-alpha-glucosidase [Metarhizium guizhouense ARSEF 977]|uniref:Proteinrelated to glucan 1, 4-alpha-glucosidase n=1 Tax=Metarhizium guizhouense (strain ARSEF 977) TaxID=1276136 RepID=A0A0B4H470_METGA|nr:proteinrelated to glucan 1, 4-alpha-glucosidase [Metarhizium guizhouense ARSEF 977]
MEDPWSSPWATDTPAPPTIDLPSEPQQAHYGNSPRKSSRSPSPWGRGIDIGVDDWGGWNEPTGGKASPCWGNSPNLKPLRSGTGVMLDPWALAVTEDKEGTKESDSAIGLGDDGRADGHDNLTRHSEGNGVWEKEHIESNQEDAAVPSHSVYMEPTRLLGERQASKVQELVEMYDGMAKTLSVEATRAETVTTKDRQVTKAKFSDHMDDGLPDAPIPPATTSTRPMDNDEMAPVADKCEAGPADLNPKTEESDLDLQTASELGDGGVPSEMVLVPDKDAKPDQITQHHGSTPPTDEATENNTLSHSPRTSIPYPVDFSSLNILFPNTQAATNTPEELPESIIKESFTSVSQRKAWYRISRFGSIRKHNSGDDDNYVRVAWKDSTIRKDTLATVRRWMEEDRIGGRVVLGRRLGHGGGSMFNWDSEAPPVEIGELLARKKQKPKGHAQQSSATLAGTVTSPIIASFGWSSSVPSSPATERISSEWHARSSRLPEMTERDEAEEKRISADMPEPNQSPKPSAAQVVPSALAPIPVSQDEDDDWGDMVSCPTLESTAAFDTASHIEAAYPPTLKPGAEASISKANEPMHASNALSEDLDPWGGLEFFGGNSTGQTLQPMPLAQEDTAALLTASENASMPAPLGQPREDESIRTSWQFSSSTSSRPASIEFSSLNSQDDEAVTTILAGLPDLSYMMR